MGKRSASAEYRSRNSERVGGLSLWWRWALNNAALLTLLVASNAALAAYWNAHPIAGCDFVCGIIVAIVEYNVLLFTFGIFLYLTRPRLIGFRANIIYFSASSCLALAIGLACGALDTSLLIVSLGPAIIIVLALSGFSTWWPRR